MLLLHVTPETGEVLFCPKCERELWPAYWHDGELEVGFFEDFDPPDGQQGLLVCGNFECDYEEPVTFVQRSDDAVVWNQDDTHMQFSDQAWWLWPQAWLQQLIDWLKRRIAKTGLPKLHATLELVEDRFEEQGARVERFLAEAEKGYPVEFHAGKQELQGQILGSHDDVLVLQTPGGEIRVIPKQSVWQPHIRYPRKPAGRSKRSQALLEDKWFGVTIGESRFLVVGGYHLQYGDATEFGLYRGRCWDPVVAAALNLKERAPGYWEGAFREEEIERFYCRHDYVKIEGYWLEEVGREEEPGIVWARTEDPAIAEALELLPQYKWESEEFGSWEGDVACYWDYFPLESIEESRWEEEVLELPPEDWPY